MPEVRSEHEQLGLLLRLDGLRRIGPVLAILPLEFGRGALGLHEELGEQDVAVEVLVQVGGGGLEETDLVSGEVVLFELRHREGLAVHLRGINGRHRLRVLLRVKRGPHLQSSVVGVEIEALAENGPLVVHLRDLAEELALLGGLELYECLLGLCFCLLQLAHLSVEDGLG